MCWKTWPSTTWSRRRRPHWIRTTSWIPRASSGLPKSPPSTMWKPTVWSGTRSWKSSARMCRPGKRRWNWNAARPKPKRASAGKLKPCRPVRLRKPSRCVSRSGPVPKPLVSRRMKNWRLRTKTSSARLKWPLKPASVRCRLRKCVFARPGSSRMLTVSGRWKSSALAWKRRWKKNARKLPISPASVLPLSATWRKRKRTSRMFATAPKQTA